MPPQLVDDHTDEACQCDQVTNVISPFGPFSSIKSRCRQCFKPVHAGQQNCPKVIKWEIFVHNLIQRWEYRYWSSLPAVRQQYFWTWFELFATYKYNTPDLLTNQLASLVALGTRDMFSGSSSSSGLQRPVPLRTSDQDPAISALARDQGPVPLASASASADQGPESSPAGRLAIDAFNRSLRKARKKEARTRAIMGLPALRPATKDPQTCANCGNQQNTRMSHCSGCRWAQYCSKACQRSHWLMGHGAECSPDERLPLGTRELYQDNVPEDPKSYAPALDIPVFEQIPDCDPPQCWILDDWVVYDQPDPDYDSQDAWSTRVAYHS